jgi:hypothetical protein
LATVGFIDQKAPQDERYSLPKFDKHFATNIGFIHQKLSNASLYGQHALPRWILPSPSSQLAESSKARLRLGQQCFLAVTVFASSDNA